MKYLITESQYNKVIDRFITYQFEPHDVKTLKKSDLGSIFWVKDGEVVAEITSSGRFWVRFDIWNFISNMFSLEHDETESVIKKWLEEHYNLGELNISRHNSRFGIDPDDDPF